MPSFKYELWDIENGVVVTRPLFIKDEDGELIVKNSSVYRENPLDACKEIQVALDQTRAEYQKRLSSRKQ
jgi:hypothetical protein